jgi:hypothetical protein
MWKFLFFLYTGSIIWLSIEFKVQNNFVQKFEGIAHVFLASGGADSLWGSSPSLRIKLGVSWYHIIMNIYWCQKWTRFPLLD